jgi:uncharacterized protein
VEHPLVLAANSRMPFGKYQGKLLVEIPEEYYLWMKNNGGFPKGKLGESMALMFEIKQNSLENLVRPLIKRN